MGNAARVAIVAALMFVAVFICAALPLHDSGDTSCGSALNPGPDSLIDDQTVECAMRVSSQQGWVFPLLILSAGVSVGALVWDDRRRGHAVGGQETTR